MNKLLLGVVVLLGIAGAYVVGIGIISGRTQTFTIETERLGTLLPHGHEVSHDSVTDTGHGKLIYSAPFVSSEDVWISGIEVELVNAPVTVLHHADVRIIGETDRLCPIVGRGRRIVSVSEDQMHEPRAVFPKGYAVLIPAGKPIRLEAMLHNPTPPVGYGGTYTDVSVRATFNIVKQDPNHPLRPLSYQFLHLQDTPCDEEFVFTVPPHAKNFHFVGDTSITPTAARMTFDRPARIVYWGGHLHGWEGGKEVIVKKNGEQIGVFQSRKAADDPYRYDTPHYPVDIRLEAGDTLSIEAVYDNPYDEAIRGAMGLIGIYYSEE